MKASLIKRLKLLFRNMSFEQALISEDQGASLFMTGRLVEWAVELFFLMVLVISLCIIGISQGIIMTGLVFVIILKVLSSKRKKEQMMHQLIDEINDFMFVYEMNLLKGMNQSNALRFALEASKLRDPTPEPEEVVLYFESIYSHAKWMVIKKISILIERNQHFSKEDLTMEFTDVTKELFERYYRMKKLEIERLENHALIPMTLNLILMIGYMVIPFIIEFF